MTENIFDGIRSTIPYTERLRSDVKRLELANAQLVKQYGELQHRYLIVSTLMRRFARLRTLDRWSSRLTGINPKFTHVRTAEEWDRLNKAMINKPWEDVTDL